MERMVSNSNAKYFVNNAPFKCFFDLHLLLDKSHKEYKKCTAGGPGYASLN